MDLFLTNMQLFTTLTDGADYWDVFHLFGLILTAPIHCRGSIDDQAMELCKISQSVLMKEQTYPHLRLPEVE